MESIQVEWTAANLDEAREIAHTLLDRRLVACANLIPNVESHYWWEGRQEVASEVKIHFKSLDLHFDAIVKVIREGASYDTPAIVKFQIHGADSRYLEWIKESVI